MSQGPEEKKPLPVVNHSVVTIGALKFMTQFFVGHNIGKHDLLNVTTSDEGVIEISGDNVGEKARYMIRFDPKAEMGKQYIFYKADLAGKTQ